MYRIFVKNIVQLNRVINMIATNYSNVRNNLKKYCDRVTEDYETVIITRKNDKNVVMISEEEYNNMLENLYIMSNKEYYNELIKRKNEINLGEGKIKELIEED